MNKRLALVAGIGNSEVRLLRASHQNQMVVLLFGCSSDTANTITLPVVDTGTELVMPGSEKY
jgi:hypothetical protein